MIKYGVAKRLLSKYAGSGGRCDPEDIDLFVKSVLQYLLFQGAHGNERAFTFQAQRGMVTLPRELEVPLKVKINGAAGSVWNRWFEYRADMDLDGAVAASNALIEDPNRYPTVFDLPAGDFYLCTHGTAIEDDDAHMIIQGTDSTGREIYTTHNGEPIVGEYLSIVKGCNIQTTAKFAKITNVYKTPTRGYSQLLWKSETGQRGFLADYDPYEESPGYRRVSLMAACPPVCGVSILGRIRLKDHYVDEDLIPFDNFHLLELAGQTLNNNHNNDLNTALAQEARVEKLVEREGNYKKVNTGNPIEILKAKSGGIIKNVSHIYRRFR